jgi:hypothetical protein
MNGAEDFIGMAAEPRKDSNEPRFTQSNSHVEHFTPVCQRRQQTLEV